MIDVKNDVSIKTKYNDKIKIIEDKIPDITTKNVLNKNLNEVKAEKRSISGLVTASALTAVENKITNVSNCVKK